MLNDKRTGKNAIPEPLYKLLNNKQLESLKSLSDEGWEVCFVRKPLFGLRIIVLHNPVENEYAVLNEDGSIDTGPELKVR